MKKLWPKSLAGRLVALLVAALALAQLALTLMLAHQQEEAAATLIHGQALNRMVTLARLLSRLPESAQPILLQSFGSRESCARLSAAAPAFDHAPTPAEEKLGELLGHMLHGLPAGPPRVVIERVGPYVHPCAGDRPDLSPDPPYRHAELPDEPFRESHRRAASVAMTAPLGDGRFLTLKVSVPLPSGWSRAAILSFLLSAFAVAGVAIVAVRAQTRSLRALAQASEKLGRGEEVAPLPTKGPHEIAAAIIAFNDMQARLGQFLRDRLKLLAGVSHDLRTPLTTLRLKAEFIDDELLRDDLVATIDEMTAICEATLAFSRAEAAVEATRAVDLCALIREVAEPIRASGGEIALDLPEKLDYACRPVALKRALRNLVENALRYGFRARIALTAEDRGVVIGVEDEGPGLPPDQIEEAFKPFVRLEPSRSHETGGIGLGLSIARSIIRAHGGTLTLANRTLQGLRAEISLPARHDVPPG